MKAQKKFDSQCFRCGRTGPVKHRGTANGGRLKVYLCQRCDGKRAVPEVVVSKSGMFGLTTCCQAAVAIDQDAQVPYCKGCYKEVNVVPAEVR